MKDKRISFELTDTQWVQVVALLFTYLHKMKSVMHNITDEEMGNVSSAMEAYCSIISMLVKEGVMTKEAEEAHGMSALKILRELARENDEQEPPTN